MSSQAPLDAASVGVVIRTLNESELLGTCLESLRRQRGGFDLDIVVVDSGSIDSTLEIAKLHRARILEVPPEDFDYGTALNLGFDEVVGEIVVVLSAHAIPTDDNWLQTMVAPFDDPKVAGVSSRQLPWPNASWKEVHRLHAQFGETRQLYNARNPDEPTFSNAASAIRFTVWRQHPFISTWAAEDMEWARRVIDLGWTIVYEPRASVLHSHDEDPRSQARRWIDIRRAQDGCEQRSLLGRARDAGGLVYRDVRSILALDVPPRRKSGYVHAVLSTAYHYVVEYNRAGSTAERRRNQGTPSTGDTPFRGANEH